MLINHLHRCTLQPMHKTRQPTQATSADAGKGLLKGKKRVSPNRATASRHSTAAHHAPFCRVPSHDQKQGLNGTRVSSPNNVFWWFCAGLHAPHVASPSAESSTGHRRPPLSPRTTAATGQAQPNGTSFGPTTTTALPRRCPPLNPTPPADHVARAPQRCRACAVPAPPARPRQGL